jgi:carbon storage regulator CsrA
VQSSELLFHAEFSADRFISRHIGRRSIEMLVLSRKRDEEIRIGDSTTITIVSIRGRSVQLGIHAPDGVRIIRTELLDRQPAPLMPDVEALTAVG